MDGQKQAMENSQGLTKKTTQPDATTFETRQCPFHGLTEFRVVKMPHDIKPLVTCVKCNLEQDAADDAREVARRKSEQAAENVKKQRDLNQRLSNAMILPRFINSTFENYIADTPEQRAALDAAKWLVDNLDSWTPGLIFIGKNGTGKNHLAASIVKEAVNKHDKTALMTSIRKMDRAFKESWRKDGLESETLKAFVSPDVLVVDELGLQRGTETEGLHLSEVVGDRYDATHPTILCGNVSVQELKVILGDRLIDRFREGGKIIPFTWDSYRGKKGGNNV